MKPSRYVSASLVNDYTGKICPVEIIDWEGSAKGTHRYTVRSVVTGQMMYDIPESSLRLHGGEKHGHL